MLSPLIKQSTNKACYMNLVFMKERIEVIWGMAVMGVMLPIMVFTAIPVNMWRRLFEKRQEYKSLCSLDSIINDTACLGD